MHQGGVTSSTSRNHATPLSSHLSPYICLKIIIIHTQVAWFFALFVSFRIISLVFSIRNELDSTFLHFREFVKMTCNKTGQQQKR